MLIAASSFLTIITEDGVPSVDDITAVLHDSYYGRPCTGKAITGKCVPSGNLGSVVGGYLAFKDGSAVASLAVFSKLKLGLLRSGLLVAWSWCTMALGDSECMHWFIVGSCRVCVSREVRCSSVAAIIRGSGSGASSISVRSPGSAGSGRMASSLGAASAAVGASVVVTLIVAKRAAAGLTWAGEYLSRLSPARCIEALDIPIETAVGFRPVNVNAGIFVSVSRSCSSGVKTGWGARRDMHRSFEFDSAISGDGVIANCGRAA